MEKPRYMLWYSKISYIFDGDRLIWDFTGDDTFAPTFRCEINKCTCLSSSYFFHPTYDHFLRKSCYFCMYPNKIKIDVRDKLKMYLVCISKQNVQHIVNQSKCVCNKVRSLVLTQCFHQSWTINRFDNFRQIRKFRSFMIFNFFSCPTCHNKCADVSNK